MYILYGFAQQIRETEKSFARPENRARSVCAAGGRDMERKEKHGEEETEL